MGHFILFGQSWTLGIDALIRGDISSSEAVLNVVVRGFLPLASIVGVFVWVSWYYGRLYCGWLCPHYSVVEMINALMRRASGKPSIWEKQVLPEQQSDGTEIRPNRRYWGFVAVVSVFFAFLWALVLLTYLLPPKTIYSNLFQGALTRNQSIFLIAATFVFLIEFVFARHLFCRFGCAVGFVQSLVWMGNKRAMVVGFNRSRGKECVACDKSCEHACPMRLKPRNIKRKMFTCTQCEECVAACERVQAVNSKSSLLQMLQGDCALDVSARDFGRRPEIPEDCFKNECKMVFVKPRLKQF